jgi:hypothetical protein
MANCSLWRKIAPKLSLRSYLQKSTFFTISEPALEWRKNFKIYIRKAPVGSGGLKSLSAPSGVSRWCYRWPWGGSWPLQMIMPSCPITLRCLPSLSAVKLQRVIPNAALFTILKIYFPHHCSGFDRWGLSTNTVLWNEYMCLFSLF